MSQQITQSESNQFLDYLILICFLVGVFKLARFIFLILTPFITRRLDLNKRYKGGWALITGGSEGIGLSIAEQLASQNFNIILISRSISKLQAAKQRLLQINSKISIQIKSVDFQKITSEQEYLSAFDEYLNKDISILVNNVGYYVPQKFNELKFQDVRREMKINLLPISVLSRLFIERMSKRQRSGIINLSSGASLTSFTGCVHYSATKKFDDYISQSLAYEFDDKIDILTVRPFMVTTPMTRNTDSFMHTSSQKCAKNIVNSLGRRSICYGPFYHTFQGVGAIFLNQALISPIFSQSMADFVPIYNNAASNQK